jgi:hypothetical protein
LLQLIGPSRVYGDASITFRVGISWGPKLVADFLIMWIKSSGLGLYSGPNGHANRGELLD